jgi:hypothetical protein
VLGAALLGLIFGIVWAFSKEGLRRLSNNPEEQTRMEELRALVSSEKKQPEPLNHS